MAAGAEFKDRWDENDMNIEWWFEIKNKHPKLYLYLKDVDDYSRQSNQTYLVMMAIRVLEMHRVLKPTGSLYYHCDDSMAHYVKIMLDIVFGMDNFKNNIIWSYNRWTAPSGKFQRMHDDILFYTKSNKYTYNTQYQEYASNTTKRKYITDENGLEYYIKKGKNIKPYKIYKNNKGTAMNDVWPIPHLGPVSKERCGWPTQKPLRLLERIILASSNKGDMVLDPFCGCATTCVAAEKLGRKWIGIDVWKEAHKIIIDRMDRDIPTDLFGERKVNTWSRPPIRTDNDPKYIEKKRRKYVSDEIKEAVYERDNGACKSCGVREELQYDHIIPFSKGGSDEIDNLQILCRSCNLAKSNKYHG